jgi:hypothetical protein
MVDFTRDADGTRKLIITRISTTNTNESSKTEQRPNDERQKSLLIFEPELGKLSQHADGLSDRQKSFEVQTADDTDDPDDTFEGFPPSTSQVPRKIKGPSSADHAIEQIMKTSVSRSEAEASITRMTEEGRLATDPEGYFRPVK